MVFKMRNAIGSVAIVATLSLTYPASGGVVVNYDASSGLTPEATGWTRYGTPMINGGTVLLQDNTGDDPVTQSGEYLSPPTPGLMQRTVGEYGIEFRVRPLSDVPFLGGSHYANAYVFWSDDQFAYNVTIDLDTDDGGAGTTGGIKFGQNSMSDAVTGIDWSTPRTIFIGYRSVGEQFDFYVDGVLKSTIGIGSMARVGGFPFAQNAVDFGDGTTGQGIDVAVEWYSMRLYDMAVPEPVSLCLMLFGGLMLRRNRRAA